MKGQVQIYTGDGKGKTTAALGLAVRAVGAGCKVFLAQFIKQGEYSEIKTLNSIDEVTIRQYGGNGFIKGEPTEEDVRRANQGLIEVEAVVKSGSHQVVIMDEVVVAISLGLLQEKRVLDILAAKPSEVELVLTGRKASEALVKQADLVTEMKEIKHYYHQGVTARVGIEK